MNEENKFGYPAPRDPQEIEDAKRGFLKAPPMSGEKYTAEEWLNHLESTDDGYLHYSQVLPVMQAYADQQSAALKAALAELIEGSEVFRKSFIVAVGEASPYARMSLIQIDRPLDRAKKLLNKQPQSESDGDKNL